MPEQRSGGVAWPARDLYLADDGECPACRRTFDGVEPTTALRGGFPVYAHDRRFATPAALDSVAAALRSALGAGALTNALAAGWSNETLLGPMGAGPLYPWKV